jgi:hypothetical protein
MLQAASSPTTTRLPTTLNPYETDNGATVDESGLTVTQSGTTSLSRAYYMASTGRFYWEVVPNSLSNVYVGVCDTYVSVTTALGSDTHAVVYKANGSVVYAGLTQANYSSFSTGDTVGVALDIPSRKVYFRLNGTWQGGSDPESGSGGVSIPAGWRLVGMVLGLLASFNQVTVNFGASSFNSTPPKGYSKVFGPVVSDYRPTTLNPYDAASQFDVGANELWFNSPVETSASWNTIRSRFSAWSKKWYWEGRQSTRSASDSATYGICSANLLVGSQRPGDTGQGLGYAAGGTIRYQNATQTTYAAFGAGDIIGIALDLDNYKIYFSKNGNWQGGSDPVSGDGGFDVPGWDSIYAAIGAFGDANRRYTINFGQSDFAFSVPIGYRPYFGGLIPDSSTYNTPDTVSLTVPDYDQLIVQVAGAGGAGANSTGGGSNGADSSVLYTIPQAYPFGGGSPTNTLTLTAQGGRGATSGGTGGTASGGDANIAGETGGPRGFVTSGGGYGGAAGGALDGFGGGETSAAAGTSGGALDGQYAGGGGASATPSGSPATSYGVGGGGGGYVKRVFIKGDRFAPLPGTNMTITVGAGGTSAGSTRGGNGADGQVKVTWTGENQ